MCPNGFEKRKRNGVIDEPKDPVVRAQFLHLAESRGESSSFCPSEVARALREDWCPLMPLVRRVGVEMVNEGYLRCTQKGHLVDAETARGAVRFSKRRDQKASFSESEDKNSRSSEGAHE